MIRRFIKFLWNSISGNKKRINYSPQKGFDITNPRGVKVWGDKDLLFVDKTAKFGGDVLVFCKARIEIGPNTMIAARTIIHTSTHNYFLSPMWLERIDRPIKIGRDVWIGTGAVILPGIIIEDFSVIAAGSVVTKNVPKGVIVAGNPAKILKERDIEYSYDLECLSTTQYEEQNIILGDYSTKWMK